MKKLLVVLVLIAAAVAAGAYWVFPSSSSRRDEGYQFVAVERGPLTDVINATGMLQADDVAVVTSKIPGIVTTVQAELNQDVKEGDVLVKLDNFREKNDIAKVQDALARVQALERGAKGAFEKQQQLADRNIGSEKELLKTRSDLDAARAGVAEARTQLALAQKQLELTEVKAPLSGTIIDKKVLIGQPVGPMASAAPATSARVPGAPGGGGPLFLIAKDLGKLQVHAQVGEGDIAKIRIGQHATFTVYAYSDTNVKFTGTVRQSAPMPTNVQGAVFYDVMLDADNQRDPGTKEWMLRLGMTATVDIVRREHPDAWKMPMAALNFLLDEHYQSDAAKAKLKSWEGRTDAEDWQHVWVMKDKKPWPIFVRTGGRNAARETGISDGKYKEVLEWDPDLQPAPDPKDPQTFPRVITAAPPYQKPGLFDRPTNLKLS